MFSVWEHKVMHLFCLVVVLDEAMKVLTLRKCKDLKTIIHQLGKALLRSIEASRLSIGIRRRRISPCLCW